MDLALGQCLVTLLTVQRHGVLRPKSQREGAEVPTEPMEPMERPRKRKKLSGSGGGSECSEWPRTTSTLRCSGKSWEGPSTRGPGQAKGVTNLGMGTGVLVRVVLVTLLVLCPRGASRPRPRQIRLFPASALGVGSARLHYVLALSRFRSACWSLAACTSDPI